MSSCRATLAACALAAAPVLAFAQAQATVEPDGHLRWALGAGASCSSANTSAASVNRTESTSLRQKLSLFPALRADGGDRGCSIRGWPFP